MTAEEKRALDRQVEKMLDRAGLEAGMPFEQARKRLQKDGFDQHAAAKWAAFHVEAHQHAPA